ncbi:MAG: prepilin-type N-terminal cleavage/methylation domain-containing protein [Longimicrobiales bacterium]
MSRQIDRAGVSLVELVIVMLLIGIMAGIVAPLLRPERFQLDAAIVLLGSTLTAQQRNSIMRQHNVVLAFDSANSLVRVHYDLDNDNTVDTGEQTSTVQLEDGVRLGRGVTPARAMSGQTVSVTETQGTFPSLTFRRNGAASEEAIVYLTSQRATNAAAYAEDGRAIEIERATGRIRCYSYGSGAWVQTC